MRVMSIRRILFISVDFLIIESCNIKRGFYIIKTQNLSKKDARRN